MSRVPQAEDDAAAAICAGLEQRADVIGAVWTACDGAFI